MNAAVNEFLFRGEIRSYWRLLARGADPKGIVQHRHTDRNFDFGVDKDGFAQRNAGIINPSECTIGAGEYIYRFVGTRAYSVDPRKAMLGNWWLDTDTWRLIMDFGRINRHSPEMSAQLFLALPDEWGDRGRVARGRLTSSLMAWRGIGNVAQGRGGNFTPAQHNKALQLFVPGDPAVIANAFAGDNAIECFYTRDHRDHWL